jgi:hypothetical protein
MNQPGVYIYNFIILFHPSHAFFGSLAMDFWYSKAVASGAKPVINV